MRFGALRIPISIQLQQPYQSIRDLERLLAKKRQALGAQRDWRFVLRLLGHHPSAATQLVAKTDTAVERRSLRELQFLLFKLKRQYRALHKRYSEIYGFSAYAQRSAQSATLTSHLAFTLIARDARRSLRSLARCRIRQLRRGKQEPGKLSLRDIDPVNIAVILKPVGTHDV